jgi:hypothetical protein
MRRNDLRNTLQTLDRSRTPVLTLQKKTYHNSKHKMVWFSSLTHTNYLTVSQKDREQLTDTQIDLDFILLFLRVGFFLGDNHLDLPSTFNNVVIVGEALTIRVCYFWLTDMQITDSICIASKYGIILGIVCTFVSGNFLFRNYYFYTEL